MPHPHLLRSVFPARRAPGPHTHARHHGAGARVHTPFKLDLLAHANVRRKLQLPDQTLRTVLSLSPFSFCGEERSRTTIRRRGERDCSLTLAPLPPSSILRSAASAASPRPPIPLRLSPHPPRRRRAPHPGRTSSSTRTTKTSRANRGRSRAIRRQSLASRRRKGSVPRTAMHAPHAAHHHTSREKS